MSWALWRLLWLRQRGGLRRRLQGLRTLRGLAMTVLSIGFILFWFFGASLVDPESLVASQSWSILSIRTAAKEVLPVLLLASCLVTVATTSGPAVYFSPAEVNFLFAGPFSRRALLLYKFFSYALGAMITALCLSIVMPRPAVVWVAAFVGMFLTLVFMQLFSAALGLVGQVAAERVYQRLRWIVIAASLGTVAFAWWQARPVASDSDLLSWLQTMRDSDAAGWLLAPFEIYTRAVMAEDLASLLYWGANALAINLGLLAAVIWLDAEYYEAVEATSRRIHERWKHYRRGRWLAAEAVTIDSHIPRLPRWGGLGPLVWRQLTTAWRTNRRALLLLHAIAAAAGVFLALAIGQGLSPWSIAGLAMSLSVVVLPRALTFDFRGDADHLAWLKVLPFRPVAVVVGQLLTPVLLATTIHLSVLGGALCCTPTASGSLLVTLAVGVMPVNFLHYALENLIYLLNPSRVAPIGRVDFEFFGRTLVETLIKMCAIAASMASGLIAAGVIYAAGGHHFVIIVTAFGLVVMIEGLLVALVAAWIFHRFDAAERPPGND